MFMLLRRSFVSLILTLHCKRIDTVLAFSGISSVATENCRQDTVKMALDAFNQSSDFPSSPIEEGISSSKYSYHLFGRFKISSSQLFHKSEYSFAMVNLRPIVPGHVLVVSNRIVPMLSDLDDDEYDDIWRTVRKVQSVLKQQYKCDAFNVAVQDGKGAGQSVPHVHVHILPRYYGDLERNDDIYDQLELWAPRDELSKKKAKLEVPEEGKRRDRTMEEMASEASIYRSLLGKQFT